MLFGGFFICLQLHSDSADKAERPENRPKRSCQMVQVHEQREDARTNHKSPVKVENLVKGITLGARMVNYSRTGLCFETNQRLHQGAEIYVGIENSPYTSPPFSSYECYRAEIIWRQELENAFFKYSYGVRYIFISGEEISKSNDLNGRKDLRKHPRQSHSISLHLATQRQRLQVFTQNISPAGAFIKTKDIHHAGKILTLVIPLKEERQALIKARVIWSNQAGCGVKFLNVVKK